MHVTIGDKILLKLGLVNLLMLHNTSTRASKPVFLVSCGCLGTLGCKIVHETNMVWNTGTEAASSQLKPSLVTLCGSKRLKNW